MFPQFGAADTFNKASTIMFRIGTDAHLYDDPEDVNIAPLLDSKFDSEKCEALKRLLALIAQGFDVSNFFPQVVKNVASQSLEVKKLVYLYLLHYAEKRPNEALLSINSFQKDLGDPNPLVRAWALRTMAGIRLHVIAPLVLVAVNKCARDPSVYVRKCAANALPKLHDLRLEEHHSTIEEILRILLSDNSPGVVGAAAAAFTSICPSNYSLLSRNYRRLCEILPDVEEWGQIVLIGILLHYVVARHGLVKESIMSTLQTRKSSQSEQDDGFDTTMGYDSELARLVSRCYIEGPDEFLSRSTNVDGVPFDISGEYFTSGRGDDVKVLLQSTSPLLWSNNSAVVLAAAGVHWIMAPKEDIKRIIKPLLFLLRSSNTSKYVILCNIQVFAKAMPSLFAPHYEDFFITSSDAYETKALKLDILCTIATDSSISSIFIEFQDYIRDPDRRFAADTVAAVGLCAERLPKMAATFLDWLLALTRQEFLTSDFESADGEAGVLIQAIVSLKQIIKQDPLTHEKVVMHLVRSLDSIRVPAARAIIIWMIGEYRNLGDIIPRMLNNVLKYLAWSFRSETLETKLQILNTTIKVLSDTKRDELSTYRKVGRYVLGLAQSDLNYDVRDRAQFLKNLFSRNLVSQEVEEDMKDELAQVLSKHMFEMQSKLNSLEPVNYRFYLPGSLSQVVVHAAPGYEPLPKPCSIILDESDQFPYMTHESNELADDMASGSDTSSEQSNEESASDYGSGHSVSSSTGGSDESVSAGEGDNTDPLIQISNADDGYKTEIGNAQSAAGIEGLISSMALESWLDDQPASSNRSSSQYSQGHKSFARISIKDIAKRIKPKSYRLLDQANGNGLKVDYSFSCEISSISSLLTCVEVSFENCSTETISELVLLEEGINKASDSAGSASVSNDVPVLVPMEEIRSLGPGQIIKRTLHIHFHHHLLPVKLVLEYNDKKLPVKLRPDIGYFVKPIAMDVEAFRVQESRLRGMFEYTRSCTFIDHVEELDKDKSDALAKDKFLILCDSLALKMLSNANLFLVSVDMPITADLDDASGLCLRFSCEIISSSVPCLITVTAEGKCYEPLNVSVKVNCEETVFGLNLLNRMINFLS